MPGNVSVIRLDRPEIRQDSAAYSISHVPASMCYRVPIPYLYAHAQVYPAKFDGMHRLSAVSPELSSTYTI